MIVAAWSASAPAAQTAATPPPLPVLPSPPAATPYAFPSPTPTPIPTPKESLTPDEVLGRTENAARLNPNPQYLVYKMHEIFVHHGKPHTYDYQVWYRSDGQGLMQNLAPGRRGKNETFFGYPFPASPDANFIFYATPPPVSTPPPPVGSPIPGNSAPIVAQQHVSSDRYYVASLSGLNRYQGHTVYLLSLRGIRNDNYHRWKQLQLWVDIDSFQVWKLSGIAGGNYGPLSGEATIQAQFAPTGNYWLMKQVTADGEGRVGFLSDSGHYEYYFSDFGFPNTLPDWYFNEADFDRHRP